MPTYDTLIYEKPEASIARIWLNRADVRNAQDTQMLYELNDAYDEAMKDHDVKVVILAAKGPHFSAGHDLKEQNGRDVLNAHKNVGSWTGDNWDGAEAYYAREKEIYEGFCKRWRDLAKPTIAAVQGKTIAGGLMLIWPCDFIIATESATFQDNTMYMGIPGVEYFAHVWELGKDAINAAFHAQGFENVQRNAFNAHHLAHTHYRLHQDGSFSDAEFLKNFAAKKRS